MKHIKEAIVIIMVCLVMSLPMPVYADSLQEVLRAQSGIEFTQEENHSPLAFQERTKEKLAEIQAEVQRAAEEAERARIREAEQKRLCEQGILVAQASENVPFAGVGFCAKYVSFCYQAAGFNYLWCDADDLYYCYCDSDNLNQAKPGMIIAVASHPHTLMGKRYGHCGILFKRDSQLWVRHNSGTIEETPIQEWIDYYGVICTPKWGWGFDEQSQSHSTSLGSYDRRGDFISRTNRVILGIAAFAVTFMSFFVDTNVANAADSLHYSSAMTVAYNTSVDGNEFLYEGYVDKEQWQSDYDTELAELRQLHSELLELQDYLSEDNKAIVNNLDFGNFKYISLLNETVNQFISMRDEALAAKEQELERQREQYELEQQQQREAEQQRQSQAVAQQSYSYSGNGSGLTRSAGVNYYNGNKETYYNLNMSGVVANAQNMGIDGSYWVRDDGVKMYGDYVIVAAQMDKGSIIQTSLGTGIILDYCQAGNIDIATTWR